jgi:DNA-binding MarR family transcriptional regulator
MRQAEPSLIYAIGRVNQGIVRAMRARLAAFSLSVQEYTTLSVLAARPGLSNAQLARRALVTPQSMIEIVAKLEARRLVHRTVDPANARVLRAEPTRAGRALLQRADPAIAEVEAQVLRALPAREREEVTRGMRRMMDSLSGR